MFYWIWLSRVLLNLEVSRFSESIRLSSILLDVPSSLVSIGRLAWVIELVIMPEPPLRDPIVVVLVIILILLPGLVVLLSIVLL